MEGTQRLAWYHTVSVKVSPGGYEDRTQTPRQSTMLAAGTSDVHRVGSIGEYLNHIRGGFDAWGRTARESENEFIERSKAVRMR